MIRKLFLKLNIVCLSLLLFACSHMQTPESEPSNQRNISMVIDDEELEVEAVRTMFKNDELWNNSEIDVTSFNKTILLTGQAPTKSLKQKAYQLTSQLPGVKRVYNEIRVAAPVSSLTYFSDISLTTKVKTALFVDDDLDSSKVKVVTEDGEVFLMGLLTKAEADKAVDITRNVSGVKRVIQAFELVARD